jgi:hypothetical protein
MKVRLCHMTGSVKTIKRKEDQYGGTYMGR